MQEKEREEGGRKERKKICIFLLLRLFGLHGVKASLEKKRKREREAFIKARGEEKHAGKGQLKRKRETILSAYEQIRLPSACASHVTERNRDVRRTYIAAGRPTRCHTGLARLA